MNSKVKVVADATTNSVITVSQNNPEYGFVRLEQTRTMFDDNNFLKLKVVSTLIHGTVAELQAAGFYAGQELPGKIVVTESMEAFNAKNPERDYKVAGNTGIICTLGGSPIYRKTTYSTASNVEDTLVRHDNVEQLRQAYSAQSKTTISTPNVNFDTQV
jgi:hypothetical protein